MRAPHRVAQEVGARLGPGALLLHDLSQAGRDRRGRAPRGTILDLLAKRAAGATICPSDAARAVGEEDTWRDLMEPAAARPAGSSPRARSRSPRRARWSTRRRPRARSGSGRSAEPLGGVHVGPGGQVAALDQRHGVGAQVGARPLVALGARRHAGPVVAPEEDGVAGRPGVRRPRERVAPSTRAAGRPLRPTSGRSTRVTTQRSSSGAGGGDRVQPGPKRGPMPSCQSSATTTRAWAGTRGPGLVGPGAQHDHHLAQPARLATAPGSQPSTSAFGRPIRRPAPAASTSPVVVTPRSCPTHPLEHVFERA